MVYLVSRVTEFASGARVPMLLKAFSDRDAAERFIRTCQQELGAFCGTRLIAPLPGGHQKMVGRGNTMLELAGISAVAYTLIEAEVVGAIAAPPRSGLIVPG